MAARLQNVWRFLMSIVPHPDNGQDSVAGGIMLCGFTIVLFFFLERKYRKLVKGEPKVADPNLPYKRVIIWENVCVFGFAHFYALYGLYLVFTQAKWQSSLEALLIHWCGLVSIPTGSHRLYSHHAFKASQLYQFVNVVCNTMLMQNSIIHWARDHRCHHKFVDTDADPYTASRGLFFSHCGWLLVERHPSVVHQGRKLDISDMTSNPLLKLQHDHNVALTLLINLLIPTIIPQIFWGERFWTAAFVCWTLPWVVSLHCTWSINSFAHYVGNKPYNTNITPVDMPWYWNLWTGGEGDHNYHHAFPRDYYGSEHVSPYRIAGNIIKFCSLFGLTYDLNTASKSLVGKVKANNYKHEGEDTY